MDANFLQGKSNRCANVQFDRSEVKVSVNLLRLGLELRSSRRTAA